MARELNARQMRFASLVASGRKTLVGAFREVYEPTNPKAAHVYRNARRLSRHPGVSARIQELQQQILPSPEDAEEIQRHAVAVAFHLSTDAKTERVRLLAAELLLAVAEKMEAARGAEQAGQTRALVELRRLYRQLTELGDAEG
jgi:hypothetical protein